MVQYLYSHKTCIVDLQLSSNVESVLLQAYSLEFHREGFVVVHLKEPEGRQELGVIALSEACWLLQGLNRIHALIMLLFPVQ